MASAYSRKTRSWNRKLDHSEHSIPMVSSQRGQKQLSLMDTVVLTPPPSQPSVETYEPRKSRRWRGKRQYEEDPPEHSKKLRNDDSHHSSPSSLDQSSSSSNPSLTAYHIEDISLEDDLDLGISTIEGMASGNDPYLTDADPGAKDNREGLHTPPMSPDMDMTSRMMQGRPETPIPRPLTPGNISPLTPAMDTGMVSSSLDNDHDTSSLVHYGPPPTPMCPPRVGNLSSISSSSSTLLLHYSSAIKTSPSTSAAPPLNILASDDDDEDENNVVVQNNSNNSPSVSHDNQNNNSDNDNFTSHNSPNDYVDKLTTSKHSPDIANDPIPPNIASTPPSPPSPTPSDMSRHNHKLRVRAPPSFSDHKSRKMKSESIDKICQNIAIRKKAVFDQAKLKLNAELPIKLVLKNLSKSGGESNSKAISNTGGESISKDTNKNGGESISKDITNKNGGESSSKDITKNGGECSSKNIGGSSAPALDTVKSTPRTQTQIPRPPRLKNNFVDFQRLNREKRTGYPSKSLKDRPKLAPDSKLMPPPPVKSSGSVPKVVQGRPPPPSTTNKVDKVKQDGSLPGSVRTAACPPEMAKDKSYIRDGNMKFLKLINFMAHSDREWNFPRGVIFINGKNGSGKSAIQLGMKILLGEKAANTLRTSSIKFFVKKGCVAACIEGHLTNYNGTLSKRRYGDVIRLRRKIKYSGGSDYTVAQRDGKWRKIKQYELGYITHALNIDPNNPFQFLQQDRFSESSKPGSSKQSSKDFIKFKAATQLSAIEDMLKQSKENLQVAMKAIVDKEEMRSFFALQEKQLGEELAKIKKMEESQNRMHELETEYVWSEVKVLEDEQKEIQEKKEKVFVQNKEMKHEKTKLENDIANFSSMEDKNKRVLKQFNLTMEELNQEKEAKVQEMREVKRTQQRAQSQHSTIISKINEYNEEIRRLESQKYTETISYEAENKKHEAAIESFKEEIVEKEGLLNTLRIERDMRSQEVNEIKAKKRQEESNIQKLESELKETNRELIKKDNFGRHMKELLKKVDKVTEKNLWARQVVGPLGAHILVPDAKYAPLIEHILYGALFTFVVQTKEDFNRLKGLIKDVYEDKGKDKNKGNDPTVILIPELNIKDYMIKLSKVKDRMSRFQTVLSLVQFKENTQEIKQMVEIGLIERINCERLILFDTNKAAATVMKDDRNFPKEFVKFGYTLQWFKVSPYPRYQFQPLSGMKCKTDIIPMAKGETAMRIKAEIGRKRQEIETCLSHLAGQNGLEKQLRNNDFAMQSVNKDINNLKHKIKHAQSCIRTDPDPGQNQKDVADQIKMVEELREGWDKNIQVPKKELELSKAEITRLKEEIEKIDAQLPELKKKIDDLEGNHNGTNRTVAKLTKEMKEYNMKIQQLDTEFKNLGNEETKVYYDLVEKEKMAADIGKRPETLNRTPDVVQRDLQDLRTFLDNNKDRLKHYHKKRVLSEYQGAQILVRQFTREINLIKELCKQFEPLIKVNTDYYEKLKKEMSNQLKSNYQRLVEAHGLTGDLVIDWEQETLVYYVSPDKMADLRAKQNYLKKDGEEVISDKQGVFNYVQGLSGGERSKALVFFIMAMWKITDMPFHVLDEFESCLDAQAREDIHATIIKHAKKHPEAQFFILTPLDLKGIPDEDDAVTRVHIEKRN